jgi:hypothetical protein
MAYAGCDEKTYTYHVRWCDQRKKKCSEVYPKDCPQVKKEAQYAEAKEAYNKRYSMGVKEYYAWCARIGKKPDMGESAEYAKKFAGPEPRQD